MIICINHKLQDQLEILALFPILENEAAEPDQFQKHFHNDTVASCCFSLVIWHRV